MREIKIVYADQDLIVIDKPADVLVHGIKSQKHSNVNQGKTLVDFLLGEFPEISSVGDDATIRPGIVHRLDRDTSGIMLVARNQKAFNFFKNLFQKHEIKKTYLALVYGLVKPVAGLIDKPIGLKSGTTKRTTVLANAKMVKPARTSYKVIKFLVARDAALNSEHFFSLVEVQPLTGRTHQIRVHLNSIGHPVVGDKIYGGKKQSAKRLALGLSRMFLHSESIEFTDLNGKRLKFSADLAPDLEQALNLLSAVQADQR